MKRAIGGAVLLYLVLSVSYAAGQDILNDQLNRGISNNESYSFILHKKALGDPKNAPELYRDALKHSPDFPYFYFRLAWLSLSSGSMFEALRYAADGIGAYGRNFWWAMSIYGLLLVSSLIAFFVSVGILVAVRLPLDMRLVRHDINEGKGNIIMILLPVALSFLGPVFFAAGLLFMVGLYMKKSYRFIVYLALAVMALSPFIVRLTNKFFTLPSSELRAIVSVNEGHNNKYALQFLKGRTDFHSKFSYALALKREGRYDEAMQLYKSISDEKNDPRVYVNLGNCYVGLGKQQQDKQLYKIYLETAEGLYMKANQTKPSVTALYNLSQVYTENLDYPKRDEYYQKAKELDKDMVLRFASVQSQNPNRLVVDETLTKSEFWDFAGRNLRTVISPFPVNSIVLTAVSLFVLVLYYFYGRSKYRSYRCVKCNTALCGRCSRDISWGNMCSKCYKSVVKISAQEPKERVARLLLIQGYQQRRRSIIKALSFAPPGVAQIYTGTVLSGMIMLLSFMFLLALLILNPLFTTGLYGFSHSWLNLPAGAALALFYLISNMSVRRRLEQGWL